MDRCTYESDYGSGSVFHLVNILCKNIVVRDCPSAFPLEVQDKLLKRARSLMYGVLLGKVNLKEVDKLISVKGDMDPLSCLVSHRYILSCNGNKKQASELDNAITQVMKCTQSSNEPILRCLVALANSIPSALEKFPFTLHSVSVSQPEVRSSGVQPYHIYSPATFHSPPWMTLSYSLSRFGPYTSTFPFNMSPGEGLFVGQRMTWSQTTNNRISSSSQSHIYKLQKITPLTEPKELSLPYIQCFSQLDDEGYVTPVTDLTSADHQTFNDELEDPTQLWSDALQVKLPQCYSWETVGMLVSEPVKPYISVASHEAIVHLSTLVNSYQDMQQMKLLSSVTEPHRISRCVFMQDVISLLVGVDSVNFLYLEEEECFVVRTGLCLEGFTVQTTKSLCQDFLFCGTYFRKLEKFSSLHNFQVENGLILKALKESVGHWTHFYYGMVLRLSSFLSTSISTILLFKVLEMVQTLKQQVESLAQLCHLNCPEPLPNGITLLAHIYRVAAVSSSHLSRLLYSVLRSCCMVYLQCLEQWIFHGHCSDEHFKDFFVQPDEQFSGHRNRLYWTRGYILNKNVVPDFLKGLENAIFDCGRAINLLLLCNPYHPLCFLLKNKHPTLRCCLFKTDLEMLQRECAEFEYEAHEKCGKPFSVLKLFEEEKKQEASLHLMIVEVQEKRAIAQAHSRDQQIKQSIERKRMQYADLKAQVEAAEQKKANEQRQQQIEDEQYLGEMKKADEAFQLQQELKRQRLNEYYESLNQIIEKQENHAEWQMKRLHLAEKRQEFFLKAEVMDLENYKGGDMIQEDDRDVFVQDITNIQASSAAECAAVGLESPVSLSTTSRTDDSKSEKPNNSMRHFELDLPHNEPDWKINRQKILGTKINLVDQLPPTEQTLSQQSKASDLEKAHSLKVDSPVVDCVEPEWIKNRRKVLGTAFGVVEQPIIKSDPITSLKEQSNQAKSFSSESNICEVNDLEPDWKKNRRKVLDSEFHLLNCENFENNAEKKAWLQICHDTSLSDLQRNRQKVLGEEFDILTGELKYKQLTSSPAVPLDAECSSLYTEVAKVEQISVEPSVVECEGSLPAVVEEESLHSQTRPSDLTLPSVSPGQSNFSLYETPNSVSDFCAFTSPFEGTNCLPHELILSSPLIPGNQSLRQKCTNMERFPIMIDIMDRFAYKLGVCDKYGSDSNGETLGSNETASGLLNSSPNTAWLEFSLQKCLLLPLRVQHQFVSAALLQHFLVDLRLLSHLKSLRSYYFMMDGEFGQYLTSKLFTEMYQVKTPSELFNVVTLNNLLRGAFATSQRAVDLNRSHLSLLVTTIPHHFSFYSPNALDCLHLVYHVPWPLNLLLTEEAIKKYNLVFLFLVRLRRVAWLLQEDFIVLKKTAHSCMKGENGNLINSVQYHKVQMIRHTMSQFVQATLNYISSSVLHASWANFEESLRQAKTIDHIYSAHIECVKQILRRCFLSSKYRRVEAVLSKVLRNILQFHSQLRVQPWQLPSKYSTYKTSTTNHLEHPNFENMESCFTHFKVCRLIRYLECLSNSLQEQHVGDLILLLNINDFYRTSDYLERAHNSNNQ